MAELKLSLETLPEFDQGTVAIAFNRELRRALADCLDRPGVKAARKVALEVSIKPDENDGSYPDVTIKVKSGTPEKTTSRTVRAHRDGLYFNSDSAENPNQTTLEYQGESDGE
jgi:hypothetical protein